MSKISRQQYSANYGPTVGDKIRLADTDLYVEIEKDLRAEYADIYGDEIIYGGGKTFRDGMGSDNQATNAGGVLDLVITNANIIDPILGVVKADVGIKDGKIAGIGKAGNPNTMAGVTPGMATGTGTDAIGGEKLILTAGGLDVHVHMICPEQAWAALSNGITTFFGGGTGPSDGSRGTTITPGPWNLEMMLRASEGIPINWGFWGKGNSSGRAPLVEQVEGGAAGFKVHEDWGTTPAALTSCLRLADDYDVAVCIHMDTLNESGFVEDSIAALEGRTVHTYHSEGAGGGHAPDTLKVVGQPNCLPSSTNPTLPYGLNSTSELFDMIMVTHSLNPSVPSDVAFAESRIRSETIAAETRLHDLGGISMVTSDSQAMGRVGENWLRTFQMADNNKRAYGRLPEDSPDNDNFRVLRYIAQMTINPAITCGISYLVGSIEKGKLADLVLWNPAFFGAKPEMVIKGGFIVWDAMGDPNASIPTPEPVYYRPMFGSFGSVPDVCCVNFMSKASCDLGIPQKYGLRRKIMPVHNTRTLTKKNMIRNSFLPDIKVNPQTYAVTIDGTHLTIPPYKNIALAQRYFFS